MDGATLSRLDMQYETSVRRVKRAMRRRRSSSAAVAREDTRHSSRPRVLVEQRDSGVRDVMARVLQYAGYEVDVCAGPEKFADCRCPLAKGEGCDLAERADVVVHCLNLGVGWNRDVLRALDREVPATPVVVEASPWQAKEHAELVEHTHRLDLPCTRRSLVAAVKAAMREREDRSS